MPPSIIFTGILMTTVILSSLLRPAEAFTTTVTSSQSTVKRSSSHASWIHRPFVYQRVPALLQHHHLQAQPTDTTTSPFITDVESHADWIELLHGHDDDRLTLVLFKAAFCKSCKRLELDWKQKILPRAGPDLVVATVEFTTNRALFKQLKIQDLPTIQFYFRGNLMTGFTCPPKEFPRTMAVLNNYLTGKDVILSGGTGVDRQP